MRKKLAVGISFCAVATALVAIVGSTATAGQDDRTFNARLTGYNEVPSVSTTGRGTFRARLNQGAQTITYRLTYSRLDSTAAVAHIHFGQPHVAGGVIAFLCGGGDKPACPASGTVTGTIDAADVIGPDAQGIEPGSFAEAVRALRAGAAYVNVHSARFPNGEIRGQVQG